MLFQRKFNLIILLLLGLSAFGFVITLITDPMSILKMIAVFLAVGAIFYFLYKRFIVKRMGKGMGQYQQAARYSKKKYQTHSRTVSKSQPTTKSSFKNNLKKHKKRKDHHLTVIEGKKGKKKNRAL
ncbi:SA1362 family protein [Alkalihalobacillus sp. AL-G]|uniref:SA1362 family protein n=1 Tax=Alkalihalobacillus sp. AL-G TaxID=2926399 RepID=UPI0027298D1A|nr:SA1362 family protein [Alkalihalobacillus sp. AL-G]WLD92007.1 hypothetical protein MOJ78_13300 [Alkalihalobacillus sp. AL-G]